MGCYNSLIVKCPKCGAELEFQSKGGSCSMDEYRDLKAVPADDRIALDGYEKTCDCGVKIVLELGMDVPPLIMEVIEP